MAGRTRPNIETTMTVHLRILTFSMALTIRSPVPAHDACRSVAATKGQWPRGTERRPHGGQLVLGMSASLGRADIAAQGAGLPETHGRHQISRPRWKALRSPLLNAET